MSERLLARTSSDVSSMPFGGGAPSRCTSPRRRRARRETASPASRRRRCRRARSACRSPSACRWRGSRRRACRPASGPSRARRRAGPLSGRRCKTASTRCNAAAISCDVMACSRGAVRGRRLWRDRRAVPRGDAMSAAPAGRSVSIPGRAANLDAARAANRGRSDRTRRRADRTSRGPGLRVRRTRADPSVARSKSRETPCIRFRKEAVSAAPSS